MSYTLQLACFSSPWTTAITSTPHASPPARANTRASTRALTASARPTRPARPQALPGPSARRPRLLTLSFLRSLSVQVGARGQHPRPPLPAGADPAAKRDVGCHGMEGAHDLEAQDASRSTAPAPAPSPGPAQRRIWQGRKRERGIEARPRRIGSSRLRRRVSCASARACGAARPRQTPSRRYMRYGRAQPSSRGNVAGKFVTYRRR
jgi:hypothetical protein